MGIAEDADSPEFSSKGFTQVKSALQVFAPEVYSAANGAAAQLLIDQHMLMAHAG